MTSQFGRRILNGMKNIQITNQSMKIRFALYKYTCSWHFSGEGNTVGEIALIKEDCVRTASVVVDEDTDLMVVDRNLYNRSVRDVLEKEFHDKTVFVDTNPLFSHWSPKMKKSLAISLKREIHLYGSPIARQGHPVDNLYIITE
jgi:CRP-like cAMP-binding protein